MFGRLRKNPVIMDATVADHKAIAQLHARCFQRGWSPAEIAKLAGQPTVFMLIARPVGDSANTVLGFNIVRKTSEEAEILSIGVDPARRGRGLADAMMREAILRLRADRVGRLLLEVNSQNAAARFLYGRLGFHVIANRPGYYRTTPNSDDPAQEESARATALVMQLNLD